MKLAILSDIHSNLEALEAVLKDLQTQTISAIYCTGDLVGYAANPNEVIDLLQQNKVKCILGNHDYACFNRRAAEAMTRDARQAIVFTRHELTSENKTYLKGLPWQISENGIYMIHGLPPAFLDEYIDLQSNRALEHAFSSFREQVAFVGHTHWIEIYELTAKGMIVKPVFTGNTFLLKPTSQYIISAGSVGQPRDDNREAGYLIYDADNQQIVKRNIPYNVQLTIQKITNAGLSVRNGRRLLKE